MLKVSFYCTSISHLTHLNSQLLSLHPLHTFTSYISLCTSVCFRIFSCGYHLWHFLQFDTQSLIALNTFENSGTKDINLLCVLKVSITFIAAT